MKNIPSGTHVRGVGHSLRRSVVACIAATVAVAGIAGCTTGPSEDEATSVIVRDFLDENWNPLNGAVNVALTVQAVYDPLIETSTPGSDPEPALAESFEVADDGLSIDLVLRDDVTFVDGTHMDAAGIEKVLNEYISNPKAAASFQTLVLLGYDPKVEVTGEYTLTMTTAQVMGQQFFWELSLAPIVSPAAIDDPSMLDDGPVGTGPYLIKEHVTSVSVTYERNPDYWDPSRFPYDELTLVAYEDDVAALNALKSDQLDVTYLAPNVAAEAESWGATIFVGPGGFTSLYVVDYNGSSPLGDIRVRRALSEAIDREAILENVNLGYGTASSIPVVPESFYYYEGEQIAYDPEHAKELLAEAGYPDGFAVTIPTFPGLAEIEPIVAQYLGDIGVTVTWENFPDYGAWATATLTGSYPLVLFGHSGENAFVVITRGDQVVPSVLDTDPELAALWDEASTGATKEARDAAATEFSKRIIEQILFIPVSNPAGIYATNGTAEVDLDGGSITLPRLYQITPAD